MRARVLFAGLGLVALVGVVPTQATADDNGTVSATVTPATPCLTLDGTTVSFGSPPFNSSPTGSDTTVQGTTNGTDTSGTTITNCSSGSENILDHGSNAVASSNASVTWTLSTASGSVCSLGANIYKYNFANSNNASVSTSNQTLFPLGSNLSSAVTHNLTMPCSGSGGAGLTMGMTITFTATF